VYDAAGNLTNTPNPGGLTMQYDAENRMTSAAGVTYTYDGDGKRVAKSSGKLYWYPSASLGAGGMSSDPLFETDAAGTVSDEYIFFAGKRTARRKSPSGEIHYYFADHLGSSRVVTSAAGAILDDSDFYPFGREVPVVSATDNSYLFTGKERDSESGLDYFIARYYSSAQSRFLSPDEFAGGPIGAYSSNDPLPPGALPYADITKPQSLNKYTYTYNNPLNYVDPNGHCPDAPVWCGDPLNQAYGMAKLPGQGTLDAAGFAPPPVGPVADGLNVLVSLAKGDLGGAGMNVVAMIPLFGDLAKAAKIGGVFGKVDNIIAKNLDPKTIEAAARELKGEIVKINPATGRAFDHVKKVQEAMEGLKNQIGELNKFLSDPQLSDKARKAIKEKLSKASKKLDEVEEQLK
jgi:RHS repeat-associated protein